MFLIVFMVALSVLLSACHKTMPDSDDERRQKTTVGIEQKQVDGTSQLRFEKAKEFALNEAPVIWETYQRLGSEIENLSKNAEKLRTTLVEFGRDPMKDPDYLKLWNQIREMKEVRRMLLVKLENACIAKAKADATPGRRDTEALWRKAQEDGIQEAEAAERRFMEMKEIK